MAEFPLSRLSPRRWAIWTQPPRLVVHCLITTVAALAVTVILSVPMPIIGMPELAIFTFLTIMGIVQAELGRQVERARRRIAGEGHINMTSVWFLPAAFLLPVPLIAVLVTVLYWHLHFRSYYRLKKVQAFRTMLGSTAAVLSCYAAGWAGGLVGGDGPREILTSGWAGLATAILGVGTYFVVNAILIIPGLNLVSWNLTDMFGGWTDNLLELATLCLGALTAVALATGPGIAALVVLPVFLLHRAVLVDQLQSEARQDDKTGVWNTAGWHRIAHHELAKATRRPGANLGVLMVDLDHFKRINDTYGHLAGDSVLKAVADTITSSVRTKDSVGRFGGEEFVVLLPDSAEPDAHAIAERIRTAITHLDLTPLVSRPGTLTASIGTATYPAAGVTMERLIHAADAAMYRAKANGRNQVATATGRTGERSGGVAS